jgi:DEAD/DEAH box helicase domain-containing protein
MTIEEFVRFLQDDREFQLQAAGHRYIGPVAARYAELEVGESIRGVLARKGITRYYRHQAETISLVRQGKNVVLMTPTASGKSLAYNVPVLESIQADPHTNALYLFPLKGLEQDQLRNLNELSGLLGIGDTGEVYDGDTSAHMRRRIREAMPNVIFTNPDMLHLALLPFHKKWEGFFRSLKYVIVDEIHAYRGVFGSHIAQIFRRLRRICEFYGAVPRFIASSATIGNPGKLAAELTGLAFEAVLENGAPSAGKHFYFMNPIESPYTAATRLFAQCMRAGLRTIVFTKARKITELIYTWTQNYAPELQGRISSYRAGFLPKERREIEAKLFSGELLGVVSTSALELGVDIGGLDCCILCGYPGSVSSTWQRAGRVGRQGDESVVVLIAIQDALDQYFMRHPGEFFAKSHEAVVVDPANKNILKKHLVCAAAELPLRQDDASYDVPLLMPVVEELTVERTLSPAKPEGIWISTNRRPHKDVSIRAIGERFALVTEAGRHIGELSGWRVFREAFPGAIYLHRGRQYAVVELDLLARKAVCREDKSRYYTQPRSEGKTEIIAEKERRRLAGIECSWGTMKITSKVTGYDKKRTFDRRRISSHNLDLPEYVFETEGLWTVMDRGTKSDIESAGFDLGGTLHAVEHTAIAAMPLFALCDRGDMGGLSHTCFQDFGLPAIFLYDGYEGGVGLTKRALEIGEDWLKATLGIIEECPCTEGCPSCVQDAQCGNRNEPLDKEGAKFLLKKWLRK